MEKSTPSREIFDASCQSSEDQDDSFMQRFGKKPVLKWNFGILSILGFSCTILGTWEILLGNIINPLQNGGSGGTIYAFVFGWTGTTAIFIVLAELVSMAPTSGGQYHWTAMLAPFKYQRFLSFITRWLAVLGWQTGLASLAFLAGTSIQGAAILGNSHLDSPPWQGTLLIFASLASSCLANLTGGKILPRVEIVVLIVHIAGFFAIMIPLARMSDREPKEVFLQFLNEGNFSSQGSSWMVGMCSCAFFFAGGDAVVHMAEEVVNPTRVIPRALLLSISINGCLGFGVLMAVLFSTTDSGSALDTPTGYPFMKIFYQATKSLPGSLAMCLLVIINYSLSLVGMLAATSRQLWSFSRDKGVPGWRWWSQTSLSTKLPVHSILITTLISALLALIHIASTVALNDILSMAISSIYLTCVMISALLLYRRISGGISPYRENEVDIVNIPGARLAWGPFHLQGVWGTSINAFAVIYLNFVVFFSFWPAKMNPSVEEMNWSVLGVSTSTIIGVVYYFVRTRNFYTGPIRETAEDSVAHID